MSIPEICRVVGKARSVVQVSIRTIRNSGISELNLKDLEKKTIKAAINEEIALLMKQQPNFRPSDVNWDAEAAKHEMMGAANE